TNDGKHAYLITDLHTDTRFIAKVSLDALNDLTPLYHEAEWDVETIKLSPDGKVLLFAVNEGGVSRLMMMDASTHEVKHIDGVPSGVISALSWLNDTQCIFTLKTPIEPGDIWQVTLPDGEVERMTDFGKSVQSVPLNEPELCHFKSFDGVEVPYF